MLGMGRGQEQCSVISEQRGDTAHLRLIGEIDLVSAPLIAGWLQDAEHDGTTAILVDLAQVTFMDASGIRVFLRAARRATESGRMFSIIRAPAAVQRILRLTGIGDLLGLDVPSSTPGSSPSDGFHRGVVTRERTPALSLVRNRTEQLLH